MVPPAGVKGHRLDQNQRKPVRTEYSTFWRTCNEKLKLTEKLGQTPMPNRRNERPPVYSNRVRNSVYLLPPLPFTSRLAAPLPPPPAWLARMSCFVKGERKSNS